LVRGVVFFLFLLIGVGFAILNDQPVSLKYYFGWTSPPWPLFLWAFLFLFLGLILSAAWAFFAKIGLHSQIRLRRRTVAELERERDRLGERGKNP